MATERKASSSTSKALYAAADEPAGTDAERAMLSELELWS